MRISLSAEVDASLLTVLSGLIVLSGLSVGAFASVQYNVTLSASEQLSVSACFEAGEVHSFKLGSTDYRALLSTLRVNDEVVRLSRGRVRLNAQAKDRAGCLNYQFDLRKALAQSESRDIGRLGDNILLNPGIWLLEPVDVPHYAIEFHVPEGFQVSAPWYPVDSSYLRYHLTASATGWNPQIAFGKFKNVPIKVGQARLDVVYLSDSTRANAGSSRSRNEAELLRWVEETASHVLLSYGEFPVQRVQVLLVSVAGAKGRMGNSRSAVPFARVLRRGGSAVQFFVNPAAPMQEFMSDWTATHEFSHLLIPYVHRDDAWISEGLASYYQNVLRARAGVLNERQAWDKLYKGFQRGSRQTYSDTLAQSIRNRGENRTMRMYWSGAAIALLTDVELRRISSGAQSLDSVLNELAACCLPSASTWTGKQLMQKLDELSGHQVFMDAYRRWVHSRHFPDTDGVFHSLGIGVRDGQVSLSNDAKESALRKNIMRRRSA